MLLKSCHHKTTSKKSSKNKTNNYDDDSDEVLSSDDYENDKETEKEAGKSYDFPEFDKAIIEAMKGFDNKIFVKLNWSSPKDAYWCLNKLSCDSLSDVYMLLSSSDFITHDLTEPFDKCDENTAEEISNACKNLKYWLVVREWVIIIPSGEFRCFVKNNKLIGKKISN